MPLPVGRPLEGQEARGLLAAVLAALLQGAIDPNTARAAAYILQVERRIAEGASWRGVSPLWKPCWPRARMERHGDGRQADRGDRPGPLPRGQSPAGPGRCLPARAGAVPGGPAQVAGGPVGRRGTAIQRGDPALPNPGKQHRHPENRCPGHQRETPGVGPHPVVSLRPPVPGRGHRLRQRRSAPADQEPQLEDRPEPADRDTPGHLPAWGVGERTRTPSPEMVAQS